MMGRVTSVSAPFRAEVVGVIDHWYSLVAELMTSEAGRRIMREDICRRLQAETLDVSAVIAAANAGHQDADLAIRAYAATFADEGRWEALPRQIQGYMVGAMLRAPTTYPRGKNLIDTWTRDIGIAVLVDLAATRWSLPPTRGGSTEAPAASYFVGLVLSKRGHKLKEQQIGRIHRDHNKLAARLARAGAF